MVATAPTFRLFVSSTFSDLKPERDVLQSRVFPHLQALCASHGARFQAVDLRWGVSEEAGLDQQTMRICLEELQRCQRQRPNFLILLGQRYGWRPLPASIPVAHWEAFLPALSHAARQRLERWYRRDDNAVPPAYVLLPRQGPFAAHEAWAAEEAALRQGLLDATAACGWPAGDARREPYEASATHQEIIHGALAVPDAADHILAYTRTIEGLPDDGRAAAYADLVSVGGEARRDLDAARRLDELAGQLRRLLPAEHFHHYQARWQDGAPTDDHLPAFARRVQDDLERLLLRELRAHAARPTPGQEDDLQQQFARERARFFVGRARERKALAEYLDRPASAPLVIHAPAGAGKTALLAYVGLEREALRPHEVVLMRFLGTTPASSGLRGLLGGLCQRLGEAYSAPRTRTQ